MALPILVALLGVSGCGEQGERVTFLLDPPRHGQRPVAGVEIGGEQRPVLFRSETFLGGSGEGTVPASRELEVPLIAPARWRAPGHLSLKALIGVGKRVRFAAPDLKTGGAPTVRLAFEPDEVGEPFQYSLLGAWLPKQGANVRRLGPVYVPHASRLRLGMGFEEKPCKEQPITDFAIDTLAGGRTRPLLRRRLDPKTACGRWTDAEVSLAPVEGQTVYFRFRVRASRAADRALRLYALWADPVIVSPRSDRPPPNVILISLDTLGARHLGTYGYSHPTSPNLDALAAQGALFTRAISHYPSTAASHMTLFTSLLPVAHGVRGLLDELPRGVPTLPELLRKAGYLTAAVTEDATLARGMGFERGFHVYWENRLSPGTTPGMARQTFRRALRWLRSSPPEPFFLFIHTYEVHTPYKPPPRYMRIVRPAPPIDDRGDAAWRYDAEVRFLDHLLGHLLTGLAREGLFERSVMVVLSDHGEAFGEHGLSEHGSMLYDEVMQVPLVWRGTGIPRGRRIAEPVGLVDVAPTILEMVGIPLPPGIHGRSLLPALRGEALPARPLVAEVRGRLMPRPGRLEPDLRAVWLADRKAIFDAARDRWSVFDLRADPGEQEDMAGSAHSTVAEAQQVLTWYDALQGPSTGKVPGPATPPVGPESVEKLRALGYVQ